MPEIIALGLGVWPTIVAYGRIKVATGIAIIGVVPTLIAPARRTKSGHENDRFDACWCNASETAWQARISGIEPSKGIYGQDR